MALLIEILPPSMIHDGHTKDEDYECTTVTTRNDFWFVIQAEERKLSDEAEEEFMRWIDSYEVRNMLYQHCESRYGWDCVSFTVPDANDRGFTYRITGVTLKKHTAVTRYL